MKPRCLTTSVLAMVAVGFGCSSGRQAKTHTLEHMDLVSIETPRLDGTPRLDSSPAEDAVHHEVGESIGEVCPLPPSACEAYEWSSQSHQCVLGPAADGTACDDDDLCTVGDKCQAGICVGGGPAACDDGKSCTADSCLAATGCLHSEACPTGQSCDLDGDCCEDLQCGFPGFQCGTHPSACGGVLECGPCPPGEECKNGVCSDGQCRLDIVDSLGGFMQALAVEDELAYAVGLYGLSVWDISSNTPTRIEKVPLPEGPEARALAVKSGVAFIARKDSTLVSIPLSGQGAGEILDSLDLPAQGRRIVLAAGKGFVLSDWGLSIVDVSDPATLQLLGGVPYQGDNGQLLVDGDFAYFTTADDGMVIADVSQASATVIVSGLFEDVSGLCIALSGNYLYTRAKLADSGLTRLEIFDNGNPAAPVPISKLEIELAPGHLVVNDGAAYLRGYAAAELAVVDVSNPAAPELLDKLSTNGGILQMIPYGNRLLAQIAQGLAIYGIDPSGSPLFFGETLEPEIPTRAVLESTWLYVIDWVFGVYCIDVSNPASMKVTDAKYLDGGIRDLSVDNGNLFVADDEEVLLYKLQSDGKLLLSGAFAAPGEYVTSVAAHGDIVWIGLGGLFQLAAVDFAQPESPLFMPVGDSPEVSLSTMQVIGDYLFAAVYYSEYELLVFDVSEPSAPIWIGNFGSQDPSFYCSYDLSIDSGVAYLSSDTSPGIVTFDVTNPLLPTYLGGAPLASADWPRFGIAAGRAFVPYPDKPLSLATGEPALVEVLDVSDPAQPTPIGMQQTVADPVCVVPFAAVAVPGRVFLLGCLGVVSADVSGCW